MSRFAGVLRDISGRLSLPQPARARVLMEIAGDLEDIYQTLLARGATEDAAARDALDHIDLSDEALRGLAAVHGGWFRRATDSIAERAGSRGNLALLVLLVLGAIALSGTVLQALPMSRAAGRWLIPVLCGAAVTLGIGAWRFTVVSLRGDHRPGRLRSGLSAMLGLSVLQMLLAFAGLGGSALGALQAIRADPAQAAFTTLHWLQGGLALLVMSLSLALVGGLIWFFLLGKVASIEHDEAEALLAG